MASLTDVLALIRQNESGGRYNLPPSANYDYPNSHASGAYQFQPATWQQWTAASGIGTQYSEAYLAPPGVQDAVAAYAAMNGPGINSSALWGASAPPGGYPAVTDVNATPADLAAATATSSPASTGSTGSTSDPLGLNAFLASIESWFGRGFLIAVGLVILAFGLWHLMGAAKPATPVTRALGDSTS